MAQDQEFMKFLDKERQLSPDFKSTYEMPDFLKGGEPEEKKGSTGIKRSYDASTCPDTFEDISEADFKGCLSEKRSAIQF